MCARVYALELTAGVPKVKTNDDIIRWVIFVLAILAGIAGIALAFNPNIWEPLFW
jgi:hypothetical protein